MKRLVAIGITVLVSVAVSQSSARAISTIKPTLFALTRHDFPARSTVIASRVEPNNRIHRDNILHFGKPFARAGRITGYFMDAIEGKRSFPRVDTTYLVSIFGSPQQAADAFAEQCYYWDAGLPPKTNALPLPPNRYGDPEAEALYSYLAPTGQTLTELLFQRGPIFVEVFQQLNIERPSRADVHSFFRIAERLDTIATTLR